MKAMKLVAHKFAELMPPMSAEDFNALRTDIEANGQQDDIVLYQGQILDGRNRHEVLAALKIKPRFTTFKGTDAEAVAFVRSRHTRRNMTTSQKAYAACNFHPHVEADAAKRKAANGGNKKAEVAKLPPPADCQKDATGKARDIAGAAFGVSGRTVADALAVKAASLEFFAKMGTGEMTLAQAKRAVHCSAKRKQLACKAALAPTTGAADIITGDCREKMPEMPGGKFRLIFLDPPYNIGKNYGRGSKADKLAPADYRAMMETCLAESHRLLTPDGALWLMINDEWVSELDLLLRNALGFHRRRWIKWYETFGTCQTANHNFNCTSRHLLYCVKSEDDFVFNDDAFMVPSARQIKYGDKRANAGGKLMDDVWDIPRLFGTATERVPGTGIKPPTQLPLELVGRIVRGCSEPGDTVFDPFTGTGTTAVASVLSGRKFVGTEREKDNAELARQRVRAELAASAVVSLNGASSPRSHRRPAG
jgi:site-specific DNA-methyltransferase (adenine-specific)